MKKYIVSFTRNSLGTPDTYQVLYQTSVNNTPRGDYLVLETDSVLKAPKVEIQNGEPVLVEDTAAAALITEQEDVDKEIAEMELGKRVIATISMRNKKKTLTVAQIKQLTQTYSEINTLLLNGSLGSAKAEIEAATPDGVLVTQADKDALLALLSEY